VTPDLVSKQTSDVAGFNKEVFYKDSFWFKIKNHYDTLINLSAIEKGSDSFELRFWIDQQITDGDHVFIVKYQNNKCEIYNYFFNEYEDEDLQLKNFNNFSYNIGKNPFFICHKISVDEIDLKNLFENTGIESLPTQSSLKNYRGCCLDGTVYFIEIATKNSYKFCVYENPSCCKDNLDKNQQFLNFISSFEKLLPKEEFCWPRCILKSPQTN